MTLAIILLMVLPRRYASEAKLIVKVGRESVTLDPTATTSQTLTMQKTQEEEINSALEVVNSRRVMELIIEKLGVNAILTGELDNRSDGSSDEGFGIRQVVGGLVGSLGDVLLNIGVRDPVSDHERAVIELQNSVHVSAPKESRVISIYSEAGSPQMAQAVVQAMSEAYVSQHMEISQTDGSFEFFEEETKKTASMLGAAKLEMAKFMSERQIVSVDSNQELVKNAWNDILGNILRLENREKELAAQYSEIHPSRQMVIAQLTAARRVLDRLKSKADDVNLQSSRTRGSINGVGSAVNSPTPLTDDTDMISRIEVLVLANNELEKYQERVQSLASQLSLHRRKLEEARLIKEQKAKNISNITVFQAATLNQKPIAPNKSLVGLGTVFFSFCSAVALAFFRDTIVRRKFLRSVNDVERTLKVPVVAKLSVDRSGAQRKLKRKRSLQRLRGQSCDIVHRIVQSNHGKAVGDSGFLVGVLGIGKGDGASTVAATLATSCSSDFGIRTVLVDADRNGRSVSHRFSLNGSPGLQELVEDDSEIQSCLQQSEMFDLTLVSSTNKGYSNKGLGALPVSGVLERLSELRKHFDVVIVDLPSASSADALVSMAPLMDHVLLVAESGGTVAETAVNVLRKFESSDTEILGVVLNKCRSEFPWRNGIRG